MINLSITDVSIRFIVAIALLSLVSNATFAGQKVRVGKKVPAKERVSIEKIDHAEWNRLLKKYVDKDGMVNYKSWLANKKDMSALDSYLNTLSTAEPNTKASNDSRLAFWINTYNAVTVKGILREYPTTSIKNHVARLVGYNIWNDLLIKVGDSEVSLNDTEHKVLRKMDEPRIHFAIVCASIGCPRLLNEAYTKEKVQKQLELNAKDFFSRKQNFQHDPANKVFHMSSILSWFGEDFGNNQADRLKKIAPWLPTEAAKIAAKGNEVRIKYLQYDWKLNDRK